jgi:hypothetical protein
MAERSAPRAISTMITPLTGCRLAITSKPSLDALRAAAARAGSRAKRNAPLRDVPMAHRGRALAIAVETGPGDATAYDHLPPQPYPHMRVRRVNELLALCGKLAQGPRDK